MGFRKVLLVSSAIIIILGLILIIKVLPTRLWRGSPSAIQLSRSGQTPTNPSSLNTTTVKTVIDGDTIILSDGTHVRYLGIDSPEISHLATSNPPQGESLKESPLKPNEDECFGQEAKKINEDLILGRNVWLEFDANKYDRYGRALAWVHLDPASARGPLKGDPFRNFGETVNLKMVRQGAAFYYWSPIPVNYTTDLIDAQEQARKERAGLWGKCGKINGECSVKGNLDRNDKRYYHLPGFKYYDSTAVNLDHGDRWFCSEEEAQKAGFKRAIE